MPTEALTCSRQPLREQKIAHDALRLLSAKTLLRTSATSPVLDYFEATWPEALYSTTIRLEKKAAVLPGGTVNPNWAGALVVAEPSIEIILSTVQREAVPERAGFRLVPFNTPVPMQVGTEKFAWVSPTTPKPITKIDWNSLRLPGGPAGRD